MISAYEYIVADKYVALQQVLKIETILHSSNVSVMCSVVDASTKRVQYSYLCAMEE